MPANYRYGLDDFVGHFDTRFGFARVRREGEGLAVDLNGEKLSLRPLGDGRFSLSGKILGLIPAELEEVTLAVSQIEGRKLLLSREDDGRFQVIGEALRPITVPQVWKARLGEYRILKPEGMVRQWTENGKVRLRLQDGFLLVEAEGAEGIELAFALQPLSVDRALVRGIGSNRGQLIRVEQVAGGEQVLYSGLRLQKI